MNGDARREARIRFFTFKGGRKCSHHQMGRWGPTGVMFRSFIDAFNGEQNPGREEEASVCDAALHTYPPRGLAFFYLDFRGSGRLFSARSAFCYDAMGELTLEATWGKR